MQKSFRSLCMTALFLGAAFVSSAQKYELPSGLNERSTLAEVVAWLDKNAFKEARVGLNTNFTETYDPSDPLNETQHHSEWFVFAKGFTLSKHEGCNLVLKNDALELLSYQSLYKEKGKGSLLDFRNAANKKFTGDLYISLDRLSYKKTKAPFLLTGKDEALSGKWRVEIKGKGDDIQMIKKKWRVPNVEVKFLYDIYLVATETGTDDDGSFNSDFLTFTFDDKDAADKFYAAFRQAINLCREN